MSWRPDIRPVNVSDPVRVSEALPAQVAQALLEAHLCHEQESSDTLAELMLQREALALTPVRHYMAFLKLVGEMSLAIAELYDWRSPPESGGKKEHLRHTGPEDIFHIAHYLYVLDDAGVEGALLECGTSHGYSTCCLSHACARLKRRLYGADSFQGLPAEAGGEAFFRPGDYLARLNDVMDNIRTHGDSQWVTLIPGWFRDSLKDWKQPIALLWLDVDLYDSARDVMNHVVNSLQLKGAVFTHEFTDFHNQLPARDAKRPPNAVLDVLESHGIKATGHHIHRYFGAFTFPESRAIESFSVAAALWPRLFRRDVRWRLYDELRNARTVRWLFAIKRTMLGR
jgi:hypothetical protein